MSSHLKVELIFWLEGNMEDSVKVKTFTNPGETILLAIALHVFWFLPRTSPTST